MGAPGVKKDEAAAERSKTFNPDTGTSNDGRAGGTLGAPRTGRAPVDPEFEQARTNWINLERAALARGVKHSELNVSIPTGITLSLLPVHDAKRKMTGLEVVPGGQGIYLGPRRKPPKGATRLYEYEIYEYFGRPEKKTHRSAALNWAELPLREGQYHIHVGTGSWLEQGQFLEVTALGLPGGVSVGRVLATRPRWSFRTGVVQHDWPFRKPWSPLIARPGEDPKLLAFRRYQYTRASAIEIETNNGLIFPDRKITYSKRIRSTPPWEGFWYLRSRAAQVAPIQLLNFLAPPAPAAPASS